MNNREQLAAWGQRVKDNPWTPVEEALPSTGGVYLAYCIVPPHICTLDFIPFVDIETGERTGFVWQRLYTRRRPPNDAVTHWMPLPPPPLP